MGIYPSQQKRNQNSRLIKPAKLQLLQIFKRNVYLHHLGYHLMLHGNYEELTLRTYRLWIRFFF